MAARSSSASFPWSSTTLPAEKSPSSRSACAMRSASRSANQRRARPWLPSSLPAITAKRCAAPAGAAAARAAMATATAVFIASSRSVTSSAGLSHPARPASPEPTPPPGGPPGRLEHTPPLPNRLAHRAGRLVDFSITRPTDCEKPFWTFLAIQAHTTRQGDISAHILRVELGDLPRGIYREDGERALFLRPHVEAQGSVGRHRVS